MELDARALHSIKERVAQLYTQECVDNGRAIYSAQLGHNCTQDCSRRSFTGFPMPVSICRESWMVHLCGQEHCNKYELPSTGGCYVCKLTGLCLDSVYVHYVTYSKQTPGKRIGDSRIKMGTQKRSKIVLGIPSSTVSAVVPKPSTTLSKCLSPIARITCIKQCLRTFLTDSPERVEIHKSQLKRFYREDIKRFKSARKVGGNVYITDVYTDILEHIRLMGPALNPPATNLTDVHLTILATSFNDYFDKVVATSARSASVPGHEALLIPSTQRQLEVFTACMCDFLAKGFQIEDTVVIDKDEWFAFHAPHIKDYGGFACMACRSMSKFRRIFQHVCVAPSSERALYNLKYKLPDEFTCRWQRKRNTSITHGDTSPSTSATQTPRQRLSSAASSLGAVPV
jgi:hypothetical protein